MRNYVKSEMDPKPYRSVLTCAVLVRPIFEDMIYAEVQYVGQKINIIFTLRFELNTVSEITSRHLYTSQTASGIVAHIDPIKNRYLCQLED